MRFTTALSQPAKVAGIASFDFRQDGCAGEERLRVRPFELSDGRCDTYAWRANVAQPQRAGVPRLVPLLARGASSVPLGRMPRGSGIDPLPSALPNRRAATASCNAVAGRCIGALFSAA